MRLMPWELAHPVSRRRVWRALLLPVLLIFVVQCAVKHRVDITPVPPGVPATIATPVRVHLTDGSTVIFAEGVAVTADAVEGRGTRYDLWRTTGVGGAGRDRGISGAPGGEQLLLVCRRPAVRR